MAFQPETEPGSSPRSISTTNKKSYDEMSISELVSVLRVAFQMKDFDEVEEELVNREAKPRAEIGSLKEKIELERLNSLRTKNVALEREICELKELKKKIVDEGKSVAELRAKIRVLAELRANYEKNELNLENGQATQTELYSAKLHLFPAYGVYSAMMPKAAALRLTGVPHPSLCSSTMQTSSNSADEALRS
ncbi:hypothetical protein ACSQ67_017729 [Phaseolus vulgaris]